MYEFLQAVVVECVPYRAGDVVPAGEIPAGSLGSLIRLRQVRPYTPPPPAPVPVAAVEPPEVPTPKPAAKKGAKTAPVAPAPEPANDRGQES